LKRLRRALVLASLSLCLAALALPAPAASARTMVSIEFDDAFSEQWALRPLLSARGVPATFFVNSSLLGTPEHMSVAQMLTLQADGHEIGGHTRTHLALPALSLTAQRDEICGDYARLRAEDMAVSDFAYPYGSYNPQTQAIVSSCGYRSARTVTGVTPPRFCGRRCRAAESVPPADVLATVTVPPIGAEARLATLQRYVKQAKRLRRGWVQIVFHHVCDGCNEKAMSVATFTSFLDWLRSPRMAPTVRLLRVDSVVAMKGPPPRPLQAPSRRKRKPRPEPT
jgi:peptidoglycan/xylan/chitin deacetylase (PgdA/CDA1 family)